jgi:transglutaminase-like putative cysteine protease
MPSPAEIAGLGVNFTGRYSVVPEPEVLRAIALSGWLSELQQGDLAKPHEAATRSLERWIGQGLRHVVRDGERLFDVSEVLNHCLLRGRQGGDPTWDRFISQGRGLARHFREPEGAAPPATDAAGRYDGLRWRVSWRREFNLEGRPPGLLLRLRIPIPYEDSTQDAIQIEPILPPVERIEVRRARESLEVRLAAADAPGQRITLGVDISARVYQRRVDVDPDRVAPYDLQSAEYALYTRPLDGLIRLSPDVRRVAAEVAGELTNPWRIAEALWAYLGDTLIMHFVHLTELDREDPLGFVLRHGWSDCYIGAALFAGLCRARGVPARVTGGISLYPAVSFLHYWAEVLIPPYGWVPMDTISWNLAAGEGSKGTWANFFRGRVDYRLKTECLPTIVTGPIGIRFPAEWYLVQTFEDGQLQIAYYDRSSGALLFRDRLRVGGSEHIVDQPAEI